MALFGYWGHSWIGYRGHSQRALMCFGSQRSICTCQMDRPTLLDVPLWPIPLFGYWGHFGLGTGALAEGINVLRESTVNLYMPDGPSHSAR